MPHPGVARLHHGRLRGGFDSPVPDAFVGGCRTFDPRRNPGIGFPRILKGVEMHAFVLERTPEPLDHHVVAPATLAIHADGDPVTAQDLQKRATGELRSEHRGTAVTRQRLVQCLHAEAHVQRVRQPPTSARP